ncbi:MAG: VWA domain-containing protein, partial [Clostridia bacterium]|nr:VWA domain-containing protein [Clostridia bacterium]
SAVIVVLDSSGSMADTSSGTKKITLAKSGIQAVIDQLHPEDMMGVIGFSDVYEWLQPLASVKAINTDAIDFKTLGAKGGTLIKPSLVVAYEAMKNVSTEKEKHILLITDGQGEQEGYEDLLTQFKKHQITLSCIGIGDDIAADFLSGLSIGSNGSFYQVSDINTLPKIMVRDIYKHGKEILQEGIFEVTRAETAEKDGSNARVKRYVATTSKPDSKVLLKLNTFDPLLVTGSYGGGKVCALTTSLSEDWSGDLLEYYGSEIMDILKHLVLTTDSRALSVSRDGNRLTIVPINSNLIKVDLLYHGNIIESFSDIILNQPMMHSVGDASGTYQINGYNLANQMIASNTIEFEYSAEHQLSTSPLWEDHPELFNITALKSQERVIKTRYLTWPLICMLFLFSIYYRGK